jgi:hypothetical protein
VIGFVILASALLVALVIYVAVHANKGNAVDLKSELISERYPGSAAFDAAFEKHVAPHTNNYFYSKIAGASFPNSDGSSRPSVIKKCEPMEQLHLELEPDNPGDPKAIAVKRADGSQLGYLERRVASDLHRDAGKPVSWCAIFKHANRHPETDKVVGATIVLTRSDYKEPEAM